MSFDRVLSASRNLVAHAIIHLVLADHRLCDVSCPRLGCGSVRPRRKLGWKRTTVAGLIVILGSLAVTTSAAAQSGDRDCADFATRIVAQQAFDDRPSDPWRLDADDDGDACEWTQQKRTWSFVGGLIGLAIGGYVLQRQTCSRTGADVDSGEIVALVLLGGFPMIAIVWAAAWISPPGWDHVGVAIATGVFCTGAGWLAMNFAERRT